MRTDLMANRSQPPMSRNAAGSAGKVGASSFTISYVLPKKHTLASLPKPKPPIRLRLVEPEIVASYRFRGNSPSDAAVRAADSLCRAAVAGS